MNQWYETKAGKARLVQENRALQESPFCDNFEFFRLESGDMAVRGIIVSQLLDMEYDLLGIYPANYPSVRMRMYILEPSLAEGTPHLYSDKSLCLDGSEQLTQKSTCATYLALSAEWIFACESWLVDGNWPGSAH
jgi:hypothetical protein